MRGGVVVFLGLISFALAIINIVLASLTLSGANKMVVSCGIVAIVSVFLGWISWFFPMILFLIGGILLLSGNRTKSNESETTIKTNNFEVIEINDK